MVKTLGNFLGLFCVFVVLGLPCRAQPRQLAVPVEDALAALHFPPSTPLDLSPDGEWVAYTLQDDRRKERRGDVRYKLFSGTGVYQEVTGCDVWITNTQSGVSQNLTEGKGSNWSPVWSPNGHRLAFYSDRSGVARLWVWERETSSLRQVSDTIVHAFYPSEVGRWSPDGRWILVKILPEGMTVEESLDAAISPQEQAIKKTENGPTVVLYRSPANSNSSTPEQRRGSNGEVDIWTTYRHADLALIEIGTGNVQRIAKGFKPAWFNISPDGKYVAFTSTKGYEAATSQNRLYDLVVVSLSDTRPRVVAPNITMGYVGTSVSWSPDGKLLSYITSGYSGRVKGDCFVVPVKGDGPRNVTPDPHPYFGNALRAPLWDATESIYLLSSDSIWKVSVRDAKAGAVAEISDKRIIEAVAPKDGGRFWSPDNGRSMIVATSDNRTKRVGFYQVDLTTGKHRRLLEEPKSYGSSPIHNIDVARDEQRIVFVAEDTQHSAELWMTGSDFKAPKQLTHINPKLDAYLMGVSRVIEWQSLDGATLRGALLLPADYQEGKRYPLIVKVYPSLNLSDDVNSFGLNRNAVGVENMQLLATRGYAVFMPDAPARNMKDIAKTVLPGVAKVVELGIADPERLGVMGHSNGGYGTLALIVQTTQFKAAIDNAGWGNEVGMYGQMRRDGSSRGVALLEETRGMDGPPWQFPSKYIENSPLFYLDKVQTPLLIIHGEADDGVPPFLADEVFVALRRLGKEVEYAKYEGEGHWQGTWGHANQVDYVNRMIAWFDDHLKQPEIKKPTSDGKKN